MVCQNMIATEHKQKSGAIKCIERLKLNIYDPRLENMLVFQKLDSPLSVNDHSNLFVEVLDAYTIGDYGTCRQKAMDGLLAAPEIFQFYEFFVKSSIYSGVDVNLPEKKPSLASEIVSSLNIIYNKDGNLAEALRIIHKNAIILGTSPLAYDLMNVFTQETNHLSERLFHKLADLNSNMLSPHHVWHYGNGSSEKQYFENLVNAFPNSIACNFHQKINQFATSQ